MARLKHQVEGEGFDSDLLIAKKDAEKDYKDQLESIGKVFWDTLTILDEKKVVEKGTNEELITYTIKVEAEVEDYIYKKDDPKSPDNINNNKVIKDGVPIDGVEEGEAYGNALITDPFAFASYKGTAQGNAKRKIKDKYPDKDIKWTDISEVGDGVILINEGEGISDQALFTNGGAIWKYKYTGKFKYSGVAGTLAPNKDLPQDSPSGGALEADETYIVPEEKTEIVNTPQEENKITEEETTKKEEQQIVTDTTKTDAEVTEENAGPSLKAQGREKLAIILNQKRSEIKRVLIPLVVSLAIALGLKFVNDQISKLTNSCPSADRLRKLLDKRNEIVDFLNKIVTKIDTISKILIGVGLVLSITKTIIKTVSTIRKIQSSVAPTLPVPGPGSPDPGNSLIVASNKSKETEEKILKTLDTISGASLSIGLALSLINAVLLKLIALLKSIDLKLVECGADQNQLLPLSPILIELDNVNTQNQQSQQNRSSEGVGFQETYNGFSLDIVEEPFTPTVNRRKGVAKNSQGIVLLETPLSFTTDSQVLVAQLKLLIDSNDLRAD